MKIPALRSVPRPSEKRVAIHVTSAGQRQVRRGHPWLFDQSITKQSHDGKPGDLAVIYDRNRKFLAVGIYDPFSPIRVRILQCRKTAEINRDWYAAKFREAAEIRKSLPKNGTDGYRLIHGENDGLPGLVADRYADTLVVKIYTAAWVVHLADVVPALLEVLPSARVVLRMNRLSRMEPDSLYGLENGRVLFGPPLDGPVVFRENGLFFEADPVKGQKTGFFLDQRENRTRVEKIAGGKDVLNVFSYTGGFSLYAARGGASSVTDVDISKPAIAASARNFKLNFNDKRIADCPHQCITADAFKTMARLCREGKRYDLVIIDPPNFAKNREEISGALNAYSRLVKLGLGLLRQGGVFVMSSCSSRIGADEFFRLVFESAAEAGRPLEELERSQHAIDHPIGFPEGAYLKCLFARVP